MYSQDVFSRLFTELLTTCKINRPVPFTSRRRRGFIPMTQLPVDISIEGETTIDGLFGLDGRLRQKLSSTNVQRIFAVQAEAWQRTGGGIGFHRDLCICAPTGSGKTLAYALPIVHALAEQTRLPQLRALVVVPTGDLASQVGQVFQTLCQAAGLKVLVARGPTQSAASHKCYIDDKQEEVMFSAPTKQILWNKPANAGSVGTSNSIDSGSFACTDIVVTPPGRLVALIRQLAGISLEHLQILVVDEADRILRQTYQGWLPLVLSRIGSRSQFASLGDRGISTRRLRKLLLSATLTRDPARLAPLGLKAARVISINNLLVATNTRYQLPSSLVEHVVIAREDAKPMVLCTLLKRLGAEPVIIFTSSVGAAHRLFRLLHSINGLASLPVEYSSYAPLSKRSSSLEMFRSGQITILVASDAATRGLDIENVGAVISYDAPEHPKTYVHRVGRTARAGRCGHAYTFCRPNEVNKFYSILTKTARQAEFRMAKRLHMSDEELSAFSLEVKHALCAIKMDMSASGAGIVHPPQEKLHFESEVTRVAANQASRNFRKVIHHGNLVVKRE